MLTGINEKNKSGKFADYVEVHEEIDAYPFDGAFACMKAVTEIFGGYNPHTIEHPFFGPIRPTTLAIETSATAREHILWGAFTVPGVEGFLTTSAAKRDGRHVFCIGGEVRHFAKDAVTRLANRTREILKEGSLYRGKAIRIRTEKNGDLDFKNPPRFLDVSRVQEDDLFFSTDVREQLDTSLFTLIKHTEACRRARVPLKRGVGLFGPYGTGKTLTATVTAKLCEQNGWTFLMLDRVSGLRDALALARQYAPAVVFAEDIDREVSGDERTVRIDDVLNTIDGLESKGTEVITILTSNHADQINRAMLRPGRLDAIINVHAPDANAAIKLVRNFGREYLRSDEDLTEVGERLNGVIPAVIREVVERAKLFAISESNGTPFSITSKDLIRAVDSMHFQLNLLKEPEQKPMSHAEVFGKVFLKSMDHAVNYGDPEDKAEPEFLALSAILGESQ